MKVEVRVDGNAERHTRHGLRDRHRWCRWERLVALPHRLPRLPLERLNPFTQLNLDGGLNITAYTNLGSAERGKCGQRRARGRGRRRTGSTSGNSRQTGLMRWPRGLARASFTSLSLNSSLCDMRRRRCLGGGCGCTCGRCASPASSALAATVPRMPSAVVPAARPEVDARCGMRSISLAGLTSRNRWRSFRFFRFTLGFLPSCLGRAGRVPKGEIFRTQQLSEIISGPWEGDKANLGSVTAVCLEHLSTG